MKKIDAPHIVDDAARQAEIAAPIVILVHGTWGRESNWANEKSVLRTALRHELPGATEYVRFIWSGQNSHKARLEAGATLSEMLRELRRTNPNRRILLIAHSHGGNVALYGIQGMTFWDHPHIEVIAGLVAIATPFIHVRSRALTDNMINLLRLFGVVGIIAVVLTVFLPVYMLVEYLQWTWWSVLLEVVLCGFGLAGLSAAFDKLASLPAILKRRQDEMQKELSVDAALRVPILSVSVARDEARGWLAFLQVIANLPAKAFAMVARTAQFSVALAMVGAFFVLFLVGAFFSETVVLSAVYGLGALLFVWYFAGLLQLPMVIFPKVLRAHAGGFGGESFLHNWLLDISVSEVPPSIPNLTNVRHEVRHFSVADLDLERSSKPALLHSILYESPKVCAEIASWLRQSCAPNTISPTSTT